MHAKMLSRIPIKIRKHVYNELPEGSVKIKSKSRPGKYWYYNKTTGEKTWHKPLPEGWVRVKSKSHPGKYWYYDRISGQKTRKRPNLRL